MRGASKALPKYRKHRASGQAIVTLNYKDYYLGPHGTKASKLEYDRVIAEWLLNGRTTDGQKDVRLSVVELIVSYLKFCDAYHRKNGQVTDEVSAVKSALRVVKNLYGRTDADEFGPMRLQVVQAEMIKLGWCRTNINCQVRRTRYRLFLLRHFSPINDSNCSASFVTVIFSSRAISAAITESIISS